MAGKTFGIARTEFQVHMGLDVYPKMRKRVHVGLDVYPRTVFWVHIKFSSYASRSP